MPDQTYTGPATTQGNLSNAVVNLNRNNGGYSTVEIQELGKGVNPNRLNYKATVTLEEGQPEEPAPEAAAAEEPAPAPAPAPVPDDSWLKADIAAWLDDKGIAYSASATKAELLALVP